MTNYDPKYQAVHEDAAWAEQYTPQVCALAGPHLLVKASPDEDLCGARDLRLRMVIPGLAVRVRRGRTADYVKTWGEYFTIRAGRPSGEPSELQKIIKGEGRWMFQGYVLDDRVVKWALIDLNAFRAQLVECKKVRTLARKRILNRDGTSFVSFRFDDFNPEPPITIARGGEL